MLPPCARWLGAFAGVGQGERRQDLCAQARAWTVFSVAAHVAALFWGTSGVAYRAIKLAATKSEGESLAELQVLDPLT